ncbi:MAG TPA: hypothetical protein VJZ04_06725 [Lachnospiraceae bacterium]|nr:hypothetical protein [Lachnospiraceae bacterium]
MKKIIAVVLVGCMTISLMACGAKEESEEQSVTTSEVTQTAEAEAESTGENVELSTENTGESAAPADEQPEVEENSDPYAERVYIGEYQGKTLVIKSANLDGNPTMIAVDDKEFEIDENGEFFLEEGNVGCILLGEAVRDENGLITEFEIKFAFSDHYILSEDESVE